MIEQYSIPLIYFAIGLLLAPFETYLVYIEKIRHPKNTVPLFLPFAGTILIWPLAVFFRIYEYCKYILYPTKKERKNKGGRE